MRLKTTKKSATSQAEHRFSGERLKGVAMPELRGTIDAVRRGNAEVASIPWMLNDNIPIMESRLQVLRDNRFDRSNSDERAALAEMLQRSVSEGSVDREIAAYRTFEFTNDVMATPFASAVFQQQNLSADEQVMMTRPRSRNSQRFNVRSQSLDGGSRSAQWRTGGTAEQLDMELLATDKVEYQVMDLQIGNVDAFDDINRELLYDMEMKIDGLALANIDSLETASGLRSLLNIHPSVVSANIPDKNYLDLSDTSYGPANKLTIVRIKEILNHIALFGAADPSQAISIQSMVISPQNIRDSWDYTDIVSGFDSSASFKQQIPSETVPTSLREQIFNTGIMTSAWGYNWSWLPNSQIAKGRLYVFTNQPVGWMFTKSEFDRMLKWDATNSPTHAEFNMGEVMWQKAIRFYMPDLWKHRIVIVDF